MSEINNGDVSTPETTSDVSTETKDVGETKSTDLSSESKMDDDLSHELDNSYESYMEEGKKYSKAEKHSEVDSDTTDSKKDTDDLDADLDNTYDSYLDNSKKEKVDRQDVETEDVSTKTDEELDSEIDNKYNEYVNEGLDAKKDVDTEKLPECFDGLSDEAKAKQIDALDKMSESERSEYYKIIEKEPAITSDVQDVADKNGAELQGLEYRVKTPSSTYEKMHEREEGTEIGDMKDVIRYTEVYPPDKLAEGTNASLEDFESKGYTVDKVKNTWDEPNASYRGINANLTSPDGQTFEVQFHTKESFDLKNGELHSLYEERRTMADDDPRAAELDDKMTELSSKLERPENIDEVKNR